MLPQNSKTINPVHLAYWWVNWELSRPQLPDDSKNLKDCLKLVELMNLGIQNPVIVHDCAYLSNKIWFDRYYHLFEDANYANDSK